MRKTMRDDAVAAAMAALSGKALDLRPEEASARDVRWVRPEEGAQVPVAKHVSVEDERLVSGEYDD